MAVTQGHGNPDWSRDETILALELYFESDMGRLSSADPKVQALSTVLRSLPYHASAAKNETFRNPAGVAFKLQNLRSVATGKGLQNVSSMDRSIWAEFGEKQGEIVRLAALIRQNISAPDDAATMPADEEFYEGRLLTRLHYARERNPKIRAKLLASRKAVASLKCDMCDIHYPGLPATVQDAAFEAHHVVPLSQGARGTRLVDMALLCACCHRLIHRVISMRKQWITIEDGRALLKSGMLVDR